MRSEEVEPPRPDWQVFLFAWALWFLLPRRYAYWSRWPSRLRGKRLAVYLALKVGQGVALRYWVVPWIRRTTRHHRRMRDELRAKLGREPSPDEMLDYVEPQGRPDLGPYRPHES